MEEIIHAFGIDWRLIVIQMVNFAVLGGALWYFLYTPVFSILKEREEKIKKGVLDAAEAERVRSEARDEKSRILKDARTDAEHIVNQAQIHADAKGSEIINEAEAHAARMIDSAKGQVEELKNQARKASEAEIAAAAILAAETILNERAHT